MKFAVAPLSTRVRSSFLPFAEYKSNGITTELNLLMLRSWLWTPTDYLFLLSNLSIFYLPLDHPVSPSLTSTTQTPTGLPSLLLFIFVHRFAFIVSYS